MTGSLNNDDSLRLPKALFLCMETGTKGLKTGLHLTRHSHGTKQIVRLFRRAQRQGAKTSAQATNPTGIQMTMITNSLAIPARLKNTALASMSVLFLSLTGLTATAEDSVPLKANLTGQLFLGAPPCGEAVGNGTLCGLFTQALVFTTLDLATGLGSGTYFQTAADGDTLYGTFSFQIVSPEGDFLGMFTVDGGDGRFQNATGGGESFGRLSFSDFSFDYRYEGTITSVGSNLCQ